ncbi:MAG: hypothetical protein ACKPKO_52240, partial [Candidatus Fonsibacter sp.]
QYQHIRSNIRQYDVVGLKCIGSNIHSPSGLGKTVTFPKCVNIRIGCCSRIYMFSPSIEVDS